MYVYLYDNFLDQRKHDSTIAEMENKLTDYGIAGKIIRLQNFTNPEGIIKEEVQRGAETIVLVGNDNTFGKVLSKAASTDVLFGFLPVGKNNSIAEVLGIPTGVEACDTLSRRRKMKLDVGWFNNQYFINQLHIPPAEISVEYDEQFTVSPTKGKIELAVCNLQPFYWKGNEEKVDVHPQDGKLEAFLRPVEEKGWFRSAEYEDVSVFPFEEMVVRGNEPFKVKADGKESKEVEVKIRLAKNRIDMIVGKDREF
ncbi:MAG: diacylglycerol kinase family protein [Candidatus Magasanikbacteria bacterium]